MGILFLLKTFNVGGVEIVSAILSNKFAAEGNNVVIFALKSTDATIEDKLSPKVKVYYGEGEKAGVNNVRILHDIYEREDVQIVVNQWGLPFTPIKLARKAEKGHKVKVISFHHNDPSTNGKLKDVEIALESCNSFFKRILLRAKSVVYKCITSKSMKYTYIHSDRFMVLSDSYIEHLQKFIGVSKETKQGVLTNPVTIDSSNFIYDFSKKPKEVIYCGRIDYNQKRVSRLIDVWNIIEKECPDWKLTIVGDGVSRKEVEDKAKSYGLKSVHFEGFQHPLEYYKRASILALTSEYEGFPLVLAECMSFGVVPVVLDSFAAAKDIVHHQKNGVLVPYDKKSGFDSVLYASMLKNVMNDDLLRQEMSLAAIETSKEYSIDTIYKQWMKVFEDLKVRP